MSVKARSAIFLILCIVLVLYQPIGRPQMDTATITGRVLDPSGAAISSASITVLNVDTQIMHTTVTNNDGLFNVSGLLPGNYRIEAAKQGFKTVIKPDVVLHVQDTIAINFNMILGSISESVTVEGGAPLVNTETGSVGTVIDRNFVSQLPLNGRSFNTLLQLTPGVVIAPSSVASSGQFSINGQRTDANYFQVDGVSVNFGISTQSATTGSYQNGAGGAQAFNAFGGTSSLVSVDAMQEFRIQTSSFSPEYGHTPGGQVMIETRSGASHFHGGIFEYFRNTVLDGNNWFNNAATPRLPRTPEQQNDFGGFLGGPIRKDKAFFFFSYEGLRLLQPQTQLVNVPSQLARTSASSAAAPYIDASPLPNGPVSSSDAYVAQLTGAYDNRITMNATSIRLDHLLTKNWTIFGRYNYAPSQIVSRSAGLSEVDTISANTTTVTLGATGELTPHLTNLFRVNYSRQSGGKISSLDAFGGAVPLNSALLLPAPLSFKKGVAILAFRDASGYSMGTQSANHEGQFNILDSLSLTLGNHQLKVGADYRQLKYFQSGLPTWFEYIPNSIQNFVSTAQINILLSQTLLPSDVLFPFFSLYAQDTWKVGQRLSLTYGLRWEFNPPPSGVNGTTLAAWQNTENPQVTSLAPSGTPIWKTTYTNFAPRVGGAYRLTSSGDLVIRGGWGIFYDLGTGVVPALSFSYPNSAAALFFQTVSLPITNVAQYAPNFSSQPPYGPGNVYGFSSGLKLPFSYEWNVALEKSFKGQQSVSVTYVGQAGRKLLRKLAERQPNSNFQNSSTFNLTTNGDSSADDGLQVQYRRPLSRSVQAILNYTWSHCLDTNSEDSYPIATGALLPAQDDRGSCDFDVRNNLTGAVTYALPQFTKERFLGQLVNNWSLDGVVQARSGFPINITYYNLTIPGITPFFSVRPDLNPGVPVWLAASAPGGKVLNPLAFDSVTPQAQGRQGNLGRNAISGFGATQIDLSIMRKFLFTEGINLQFRADMFNLLNHPNFSNPDSNLSDGLPTFGVAAQMLSSGLGGLTPLYQVGGPRSIQLSLKLIF